MTMKIHFAPNTRAVRIVWLFEELGLPYELAHFKLGDASMRTPEYLALNPMGRVPTLQDGNVTLFESGAIVEYMLARHGGGRMVPAVDSPEFPNYLQWLHYAEGMLMPQANIVVVETKLLPEHRRNPVNVDRARKVMTRALEAVETGLQGREYLAGEFSGADIMTGHACTVCARLGADIADKPLVTAYIARVNERPALKKAWSV